MPHAYNRKAFRQVIELKNPLAGIYGSLVEIELALKDKHLLDTGIWRKGHHLVTWIAALGEASAAETLRNELAKLACTDITGKQAQVDAEKYPDLRYLRHAEDFPGGCDEPLLQSVLATVKSTRRLLATKGVIYD